MLKNGPKGFNLNSGDIITRTISLETNIEDDIICVADNKETTRRA